MEVALDIMTVSGAFYNVKLESLLFNQRVTLDISTSYAIHY
jgi:hypothetical protein